MKPIEELTKEALQDIKMLVFDVDGVLVPRGTKIRQRNSVTTLETKHIPEEQIDQMRQLKELGFIVNISSGRGLYMLQDMFRDILSFTSLTFENGSATWYEGDIIQHVNSFKYLEQVFLDLRGIEDRDERVKGFEPKEFIITIHCEEPVQEIEDVIAQYPDLYTIWNGEAYDIGVTGIQNKSVGMQAFWKHLGFDQKNVLAIGDNYNDKEMIDTAGLSVSADKTRLEGNYFVPLEGDHLPAYLLMRQIIEVMK